MVTRGLRTNEKASSLQRQEVDRNARGATPVTFFSPRDQKGREGSRIEGDDLRPDPRGMASALYGSIKQAEGGCLPHHMGSQSLFGTQTQFPPLGAYQSPPLGAYQSPPTGAYQIPPAGAYQQPRSYPAEGPPSVALRRDIPYQPYPPNNYPNQPSQQASQVLEEEEDGNDLENQLAQAKQWTNEEAVEADQPRTARAPIAQPEEP